MQHTTRSGKGKKQIKKSYVQKLGLSDIELEGQSDDFYRSDGLRDLHGAVHLLHWSVSESLAQQEQG